MTMHQHTLLVGLGDARLVGFANSVVTSVNAQSWSGPHSHAEELLKGLSDVCQIR